MPKVVVRNFSISIDGYGAGPDQSLQNPLGVNGETLHQWAFKTRTFHRMFGKEGGSTSTDEDFTEKSFANIGAWILGRNMFGPIRGAWPDENWKGWWGDEPPYHVPVFVLTHHARASFTMKGGTVFHFVTTGIKAALDMALEAANGKDVRIGGGVSTIRQYMAEGMIDELHLALAPVFLGRGENLFEGLDMPALGYRCTGTVAGEGATHLVIDKG
ncbi:MULTISPECIES: dihydrofolate reductase family protein [unclassified Rhizobium]|uniref:dihydrofolate reductase family protein n=1 Tax=unclassified Rhizobium TaxID=2613769 RepID=UPI0024789BEF|nr:MULTISPECIES: dihydrofolate reductase family protein [unclassified Rhizobium]MDH7800504.1 dihydrofolate reductase [Rhizobium sp. AN70]